MLTEHITYFFFLIKRFYKLLVAIFDLYCGIKVADRLHHVQKLLAVPKRLGRIARKDPRFSIAALSSSESG